MIFITGDVHQAGMGGPDQNWLDAWGGGKEAGLAVKFVQIAETHGLPVTLFFAGLLGLTESDLLRDLRACSNLEVGGHTWKSLQPAWRHFLSEGTSGSHYGPAAFQRADIRRTTRTLERVFETPIQVWRTHSYRGDTTTFRILDDEGFKVVSDLVDPKAGIQRIGENLFSLPINTPPDHDHMAHGYLQSPPENEAKGHAGKPLKGRALAGAKEPIKRALGVKGLHFPFGGSRVMKASWASWVRDEAERRIDEQGFATLLLHPACMEIVDGMATFEQLLGHFSAFDCRFVSQAAGRVA